MLSVLPNGLEKEESIMKIFVLVNTDIDIDSPNLKDIIESYRRRKSSVEDVLIEMYLG